MSALWSVDLSLCCRCPTASLLLMPSILCPRVIPCACYLFPLCNVYVCRSGYCESVLPCWCGWNQVTHTNGTHCSIILIFALLSGWATCFAYHLLIIFIHYYNYLSLYFSVSPKCDSLFVYPEPHVILVHCPITSPLFAVANCWWFACDWCVWRSLPLMWADLFFFWPYMARYGICCACVRFRLIWDDLVLIYCIAQLRSLFFSFCPPRLMVRLWLVCVEIPTLMVGRSRWQIYFSSGHIWSDTVSAVPVFISILSRMTSCWFSALPNYVPFFLPSPFVDGSLVIGVCQNPYPWRWGIYSSSGHIWPDMVCCACVRRALCRLIWHAPFWLCSADCLIWHILFHEGLTLLLHAAFIFL